MVFSLSNQLSGVSPGISGRGTLLILSQSAIVDFVQALSEVSWEEIQSSGQSENPRLFSIRKLVEICYYNMNRIRLEWVNVWAILGEHFNQVISFSVLQIYTQLRTGLLPQQCSCQQLCIGLSEAARHALP
jgi:hypothetical protein